MFSGIVERMGEVVEIRTDRQNKDFTLRADFCKELKKPTFIMIKRKDKDTYDFDELVQSIRDKFGAVCVPASYPIKPEMLEALNELIAETDS